MNIETEVLIVGAGAAGCTLGYLLRQSGAEVLAIEIRDASSKDKLCGGILSPVASRHLEEIYGKEAFDELDLLWPQHLVYRALGRRDVQGSDFATIPRIRLDRWLLSRFVGAGGTVRDRIRIDAIDPSAHLATCTDLRTHDVISISYGTLVGADGAASSVRRILTGRGQRTAASLQGQVALAGEDIVFSYHPARTGYCWYIPTKEGAIAGCGLYNAGARACREWLAEFCGETGLDPSDVRGALIPTGDDVLLAPAEDVWLIGDAAGLISPYVGGGIHYAFDSARVLAAAIAGGTPYEEAMAPLAEAITSKASKIKNAYLRVSLIIACTGEEELG